MLQHETYPDMPSSCCSCLLARPALVESQRSIQLGLRIWPDSLPRTQCSAPNLAMPVGKQSWNRLAARTAASACSRALKAPTASGVLCQARPQIQTLAPRYRPHPCRLQPQACVLKRSMMLCS